MYATRSYFLHVHKSHRPEVKRPTARAPPRMNTTNNKLQHPTIMPLKCFSAHAAWPLTFTVLSPKAEPRVASWITRVLPMKTVGIGITIGAE